ncbi:MAG: DUF2786 domain-containing protein [Verrucomicrobiaceae bacterium]|nr:DUF2786 domain-containing protein [Verrucomicrobiaceae bacterium]
MSDHLDKIKKLLRLSKSSNAHEAELALARAMELAMKHGIDLAELADDAEAGGIVHRWFPLKARLAREWKLALNIAANFFEVSPCVCRNRRQVLFVGREDAITVADYIVTFLVRESRRLCAAYAEEVKAARRKMTSGKRAAFISGFFTAIGAKLTEGRFDMMRENDRFAIVLRTEKEKRDGEMGRVIGKTKTLPIKKVKRSAATLAGWMAGETTNLQRPLDGAANADGALSQGTLTLT